ncbi:putative glycosyltransferase [Vibrio chagasii]|nr:putative glycosyltransferase [Vibrio chagasii]
MKNMTVNYRVIPGQENIINQIISNNYPIDNLLDIGFGNGFASKKFRDAGVAVTATGFNIEEYKPEDIEGIDIVPDVDITNMNEFPDNCFDAVWCAHVLEHVANTKDALSEVWRVLKPGGYLFVSVPPFKHEVVGGHITPGWNVGILAYNLMLEGFSLYSGSLVKHGYNISAVAQKANKPDYTKLKHGNGDLELLSEQGLFPKGHYIKQGFQGNKLNINWKWTCLPETPINIGMFIPWISQGKGGTENVGSMIANAMSRFGHNVTIFTFDDQSRPSQWLLEENIKIVYLPENIDNSELDAIGYKIAQHAIEVFVGLHMNREFFKYVYWSQQLDIPVILSEHINPAYPRKIGTFEREERETIFSGANHIHLISNQYLSTLPYSFLDKTTVINNTVVKARDIADVCDETAPKILCVSRLVDRKRIHLLIQAFAKIASDYKSWKLTIVGYGNLSETLKNLAIELGVSEYVEFLGKVDDPYPLYESSNIFVLPSETEGFPLTVLEAMQHSLPIVGYSTCNGLNEQVIHGETGLLCDNRNPVESLSSALRVYIEDSNKRREHGEQSKQRFDKLYGNESIFSQWHRLIKKVKNEKHSSLKLYKEEQDDNKNKLLGLIDG